MQPEASGEIRDTQPFPGLGLAKHPIVRSQCSLCPINIRQLLHCDPIEMIKLAFYLIGNSIPFCVSSEVVEAVFTQKCIISLDKYSDYLFFSKCVN